MIARAIKYGYSNTRVKVMLASLLSKETLDRLKEAQGIDDEIGILYSTPYKQSLVEFGGNEIRPSLVDFALSKNLAESIYKLVSIAPYSDKQLMEAVVARWDLHNVELALEAKAEGSPYEAIASYVVDAGDFKEDVLKEAVEKRSVQEMLSGLIEHSIRYKTALEQARNAYEKSGAFSAINVLEMQAFSILAQAIRSIRQREPVAAKIAGLSIDLQNLRNLIRAKVSNAEFPEQKMISQGTIPIAKLKHAYSNSKDEKEMLALIEHPDFKEAVAKYEESGLLSTLDIQLAKVFQKEAIRLAKFGTLSLAIVIAYFYYKEQEVITIRSIIKAKQYGLSREKVEVFA